MKAAYRKLNESFRPTCVYHLGASAGFFSEYNMMLLAMLYCLTRRIRFTLYSADANFAFRKGWTDYFEPFCPETSARHHHYLNHRATGSWRTVWKRARQGNAFSLMAGKLKRYVLNAAALCFKLREGSRYYTQDIWQPMLGMKADGHYSIPELGIDGNLAEALRQLTRLTWRFNEETEREVRPLIRQAALPDNYAGCQIRGGDKYTEFDLVDPAAYIQALEKRGNVRDVFVLTDDYRIFRQLQKDCPAYAWHTLCLPSEHGYYHRDFTRNSRTALHRQLIRLLASMEVLCHASFFIGTRTSNPSVFLYMYHPHRCVDADGRKDLLTRSTLGVGNNDGRPT